MGTSQSSPGLGKNSPLVPPWADEPSNSPAQIGDFRQAMRGAAQGGGSDSIKKALGYYAREVTGGGKIAVQRLGGALQGGVDLYGTLSGSDNSLIDIALLVGKPCDEVIGLISQALAKDNGDADKIHAATTQALSDALEGNGLFTPEMMNNDIISATMVNYHTEIITNQMIQDSGNSWNKASAPAQMVTAENQLRELVWVVVDKHMTPKLQGARNSLSAKDIRKIEETVIQEVWADWEAYQ